MTLRTRNPLIHAVILGSFALGDLPFGAQDAQPDPAVAGLPAALVAALASTCLGGDSPYDHRPCDKSACHAALTVKRKLNKKLPQPA
ncbi:MAG: hypothetical protein ABF335_05500 [Alphaproteobacteria bacterium]